MRQLTVLGAALLMVALALVGCERRADQTAATSSDSLLAANPVEPPQSGITPQTEYQPPQQQQTPPAPRPAQRRTPAPKPAPTPEPAPQASAPGITVPAGSGIKINVNAQISTETAQRGDVWTGEVSQPLVIGTAAPIPAGSKVSGVVSGVMPAQKGSRAFLVLAVRTIEIEGRTHTINATADSIIAGSTRARNLGAIAGTAAAGALIGKAVGGGDKGALVGGLIGGAVGTGAVAASKGYQVVLKEGTELVFHTEDSIVMK